MQSFAPVTPDELRAPIQRMLFKVEVWDGAAWRNLSDLGGKNYLKAVSVSMGGAKDSPTPTAGTWAAVVDNPLGIFHPKHPTSTWATLLQTGREVRIYVGARYGGVARYYQRMTGFMEAPTISHDSHEVEINGQDYTQLLTNTVLGEVDPIAESGSGSGSTEIPDQVNGPLHWGARASFDSKATGGAGSELYDENDACEIGAGEADNVASWAAGPSGAVSSEGPAQESSYMLRLTRSEDWMAVGDEYCQDTNVASLTAGQQYIMTFWARCVYNSSDSGGYARLQALQGTNVLQQETISSTDWSQYTMLFTAGATAALILKYISSGKYSKAGDAIELDEISIKTYDPDTWEQYDMPPECMGPYFVTYNGDPIGQGYQDTELSWHYDQGAKTVYLSEDWAIENGTDNLKIYYYTAQVLENVLADLLVYCGLYAGRAAALADLDYVPTGITIDRAWFDPNTTALAAVAKICERANYRFWFAYDGKPCFQPAPVADSIDWTFDSWGELQALIERQDDGMVQNKVTIEGCQRNMYQLTRDDKASDRWKATASKALGAGEITHSKNIQNHLFQDQASCNSMAAEILAQYQDPKWYADLTAFANPVPLEIGDLVAFPTQLEPPITTGGTGAVEILQMGIIRDIKLSDHQAVYKLEIAEEFWSTGSVSQSESQSPSESPSESLVESCSLVWQEEFDFGAGCGEGLEYEVPSGVSEIRFRTFGQGGKGGQDEGGYLGGGGGGGGAYSERTISVTPGETLIFWAGDGSQSTVAMDTEVWRGATCLVRAKSGIDGTENAYGAGGAAGSCIGDITYSGGHGAAAQGASLDRGGGGGSSAGPAANGNNTSTISGAAAPAGGGAGGDGGLADSMGDTAITPGGGGGGAGRDEGSTPIPGNGGWGKIYLDYC